MDTILETIWAFIQAIMANPLAAGAIYGVLRNFTGYLQRIYKEKTGQTYDPKILAADILKYEVVVNSIFATLPADTASKLAPLAILADIAYSAAKKLKNGTTPAVTPSTEKPESEAVPTIPDIASSPPIAAPVITYGSWQKGEDAKGNPLWARPMYTDGKQLKGMAGWQYSTTDPTYAITPPT